jgi:hypothetical protein
MRVAVRKEVGGDRRVAIVPDSVKRLAAKKIDVSVESGAGALAFVPDDEYKAVGARLDATLDALLGDADVVLPDADDRGRYDRAGQGARPRRGRCGPAGHRHGAAAGGGGRGVRRAQGGQRASREPGGQVRRCRRGGRTGRGRLREGAGGRIQAQAGRSDRAARGQGRRRHLHRPDSRAARARPRHGRHGQVDAARQRGRRPRGGAAECDPFGHLGHRDPGADRDADAAAEHEAREEFTDGRNRGGAAESRLASGRCLVRPASGKGDIDPAARSLHPPLLELSRCRLDALFAFLAAEKLSESVLGRGNEDE